MGKTRRRAEMREMCRSMPFEGAADVNRTLQRAAVLIRSLYCTVRTAFASEIRHNYIRIRHSYVSITYLSCERRPLEDV
jgi:hypothetical protein